MALALQKRNNVSKMRNLRRDVLKKKMKQNSFLFSCLQTQHFLNLINRFQIRLPPEVNRVLYIRNLPYKITSDEIYDIVGKYGAIRQIRV